MLRPQWAPYGRNGGCRCRTRRAKVMAVFGGAENLPNLVVVMGPTGCPAEQCRCQVRCLLFPWAGAVCESEPTRQHASGVDSYAGAPRFSGALSIGSPVQQALGIERAVEIPIFLPASAVVNLGVAEQQWQVAASSAVQGLKRASL